MTSSSDHVLSEGPDPLADKPSSPLPRAANWKLVLAMLIVLPLLFVLILSGLMGTPREGFDSGYVFAELGLPVVATTSLDSLAYGNLLFIRLEVGQEESRKTLLRSLSTFEVSRGRPEKPISLKLEREWWNLPEAEQGTTWKAGRASLWNPDSQPETFYAVVSQAR